MAGCDRRANLQPEVRPLFRAAAEHVRHNPEGLSLEDRDPLAEALEAPWGIRIEKRHWEVFTPETARGRESTRKIAEVVRERGLQPWQALEPLDPIEDDEIHLIVGMGLATEEP